MATTYTYPDAYLARFCTEEREARALADVTLPASVGAAVADRSMVARLLHLALLDALVLETALRKGSTAGLADQPE